MLMYLCFHWWINLQLWNETVSQWSRYPKVKGMNATIKERKEKLMLHTEASVFRIVTCHTHRVWGSISAFRISTNLYLECINLPSHTNGGKWRNTLMSLKETFWLFFFLMSLYCWGKTNNFLDCNVNIQEASLIFHGNLMHA